jgi:hypothetical protein
MRIILYLLLAPLFVFGQGEQRYADGTATDQDGNSFGWINYGTQDWAIENAEVVNYRDGSAIPKVTDATKWLLFALFDDFKCLCSVVLCGDLQDIRPATDVA